MSRPRRTDTVATERIRVRVTPDERRDLARVARDNHTDISHVIREAVNEYVADYGERRVFVGRNQPTQ